MTPIEKAKDLLHNYEVQVRFSMEDCSFTYRDSDYGLAVKRTAKQCALIAVNEMMHQIRFHLAYGYEKQLEYWNEVKHELEYMYTKQLPK
jgi:hypothetical protein